MRTWGRLFADDLATLDGPSRGLLHHEADIFQARYIFEWISLHGDQIGEHSGFDGAEVADGGKARHQRASGVARAAQREIGETFLDRLVDPIVRQVVGQMRVGVDQSG